MPGFIGAMARPDSSGAGSLSSYGKRHEPLERDEVFPYDRDNTYGLPGSHDRTMPGKNTRGLVPRDAEENPWDELEEMVLAAEAKERPKDVEIIDGADFPTDGPDDAWQKWKRDFGDDETAARAAIAKWRFGVTGETVVALELHEPYRRVAWTEEDNMWDSIVYTSSRVSPEQKEEIKTALRAVASAPQTNEAKDRPEESALDRFPGALDALEIWLDGINSDEDERVASIQVDDYTFDVTPKGWLYANLRDTHDEYGGGVTTLVWFQRDKEWVAHYSPQEANIDAWGPPPEMNEITGYPVSFTKQSQGGGRTLPGTSGAWATGWTDETPDDEEIEKAGAGLTKHARGPQGRTFASGANMNHRGMMRREAKERPSGIEVFDFSDLDNVNPIAYDAWMEDPSFVGNTGKGWICASSESGVTLTISSHPAVQAGRADSYLVFNPSRGTRNKPGWMTWEYMKQYFPNIVQEANKLRDILRFHKEDKIGEAKDRPEDTPWLPDHLQYLFDELIDYWVKKLRERGFASAMEFVKDELSANVSYGGEDWSNMMRAAREYLRAVQRDEGLKEMKTPWQVLEAFVSLRSTPSEPMGDGQSVDGMELDAKVGEFRNAFDRSLEIVTKLPESEVLRLIVDLDPEYAASEFLGGMGSEELADIYRSWGDQVAPQQDGPETDETDDTEDEIIGL